MSRVRWNGELYIHKNLAVNIVVRLPHLRSTDSQSLYNYNISKRWNVSKIKILSGPILVKMLKVIQYLLDKHFVRNDKYHKIFNRNNSKLVVIA